MPKKKLKESSERPPLSRLESVVMGVIWELEEATAKSIRARLMDRRPLAHTTVLTVLTRLKEKGYVAEVPSLGRSLTFRPTVEKQKVAKEDIRELVARFFGGSPKELVAHLIAEEEITRQELEDLRKKLR